MKSIRAGKGLGDSLYLQAVARHMVNRGERLKVCSGWPDVFRPLGDSVRVIPFSRQADICAHYTLRKWRTDSDQFQDCCIQAGIREPVDFRLDWKAGKTLIDHLPKPVVLVLLYRLPMDRVDGFAAELLPDFRQMQRMIDALKGRATVVQVGSGKPLREYEGIDLDLANRTSVSELLDVASVADGMLGYCSFFVPLAESLNKKAAFLWARKGVNSRTPYIRQITPTKILHKDTSSYVFDDDPRAEEAVEFLLRPGSGRGDDPWQVGGTRRVGAWLPG